MEGILIEATGWIGTIIVLIAYGLIATKKLTGTSKIYHFLNLLGAGLILIYVFIYGAYAQVLLNAAWAMIAIYGIYKAVKKRQ
ncbi:MAG: hypothetical protein PHU12_00165 [Candidatus Aenigmarchaeota archaeon]|nr:hypothetical protein [Candidatus Aenigmarchaeota archaeon]